MRSPTALFVSLNANRSDAHRDLHSFPTRRSSDLERRAATRARSRGSSARGAGKQRSYVSSRTERNRSPASSRSARRRDRKSTRLNSSHPSSSYAVFCLKKETGQQTPAKRHGQGSA